MDIVPCNLTRRLYVDMHPYARARLLTGRKEGNYLFMLTTIKCIAPHCKRVNVRKPLVASINLASHPEPLVRASDMRRDTYQL